MSESFTFTAIGHVRSPITERLRAARQPTAEGARGVEGRIELVPGLGLDDAVADLAGWQYVWVLFVFHKNVEEARGWKPKVLPPRSAEKRGVLATRSPHRPNPIGMSVVELVRVSGLTLEVRNLDILDGTPVLDLKPYVPYADAYPEAQTGWLDAPRDPDPGYAVEWSERSATQLDWLEQTHAIRLRAPILEVLTLGPQPHAYRRIRKAEGEDGFVLSLKEWRVRFEVDGRTIHVRALRSGYRPAQIAQDPALGVHRDFVARFGAL